MRSDELLALFRADVVDDVSPYLWSDTEVYAYMNDAYYMYVRLTGGISDATSTLTQIPITAGEADAAIDPAIMRVRQATRVSDNREITVINAQDIDNLTDEDYGVLRRINNITTVGEVCYMITGLEDELVRWVQVPAEDDTCQMVVERLPCSTITGEKQTFSGVGEEHHYHFLKWMRHLAYRKQDADSFNLIKSDNEKSDFVDYCELAKNEKARRRHKVRVVSYGGL